MLRPQRDSRARARTTTIIYNGMLGGAARRGGPGALSNRALLRTEPPRPRVVVYGAACVDVITSVPAFPEQDSKIRCVLLTSQDGFLASASPIDEFDPPNQL